MRTIVPIRAKSTYFTKEPRMSAPSTGSFSKKIKKAKKPKKSPNSESKQTPEKKITRKYIKKSKVDVAQEEKPEEIEVTMAYLSNRKEEKPLEKDLPIKKKSGRKAKEPKPLPQPQIETETEEPQTQPRKRGRQPPQKKEDIEEAKEPKSNESKTKEVTSSKASKKKSIIPRNPYQEKESILSVLEQLKSGCSYKVLLHQIKESFQIETDSQVKLDLAALERSGLVIFEKGTYELYKDIPLNSNPKDSIKKNLASELKDPKTSRKKTSKAKNPFGRKGKGSSSKKSLIKDDDIEEEPQIEIVEKIPTIEILGEDSDDQEEKEMMKSEEIEIKPASTRKSEKKTLINLEQDFD